MTARCHQKIRPNRRVFLFRKQAHRQIMWLPTSSTAGPNFAMSAELKAISQKKRRSKLRPPQSRRSRRTTVQINVHGPEKGALAVPSLRNRRCGRRSCPAGRSALYRCEAGPAPPTVGHSGTRIMQRSGHRSRSCVAPPKPSTSSRNPTARSMSGRKMRCSSPRWSTTRTSCPGRCSANRRAPAFA
jgi:hypothetical protein